MNSLSRAYNTLAYSVQHTTSDEYRSATSAFGKNHARTCTEKQIDSIPFDISTIHIHNIRAYGVRCAIDRPFLSII